MLVLSRKQNEVIQIGENIRVVVVEIRKGEIRLGISAPKEVAISRPDATNQHPKGWKP